MPQALYMTVVDEKKDPEKVQFTQIVKRNT